MKVRVEDLHRKPEQDRLVEAASRTRRIRAGHGTQWTPGHPPIVLSRRVLAILGARRLPPGSSQSGKRPPPHGQAAGRPPCTRTIRHQITNTRVSGPH